MNTPRPRKVVAISDFLTEERMAKAIELKTADKIHEQITKPNIDAISKKIGQPMDAKYLAYALEYALNQMKTKPKLH